MERFEGSFFEDLRQFELEKPRVQTSVASTESLIQGQGIFAEEESVDLSSLLAFDETYPVAKDQLNAVVSTSSASLDPQSDYSDQKPSLAPSSPWQLGDCSEVNFSFRNYLPPAPTSTSTHSVSMYDVSGINQTNMPVSVEAVTVQTTGTTASHQLSSVGMSPLGGTRPAPGKASKTKKKRMPEKGTCEYRQKRDRNNVAVRKSREKSKMRVQETEQRVKELEDENQRLQSKITLLSKELNVLKSLFTSAGVSQPASLKDGTSALN